MGYSALEHGNFYQVLLSGLSALGNSSGDFTSLTKTIADDAVTVTYNDHGSKRKGTTTFSHFRYTVDLNEAIFQFCVAIHFYFIHCHNRLKFKTSFAGCVCQIAGKPRAARAFYAQENAKTVS